MVTEESEKLEKMYMKIIKLLKIINISQFSYNYLKNITNKYRANHVTKSKFINKKS